MECSLKNLGYVTPPKKENPQTLAFKSELVIKALSFNLQDPHSVPSSASDLGQVISFFPALILFLK